MKWHVLKAALGLSFFFFTSVFSVILMVSLKDVTFLFSTSGRESIC